MGRIDEKIGKSLMCFEKPIQRSVRYSTEPLDDVLRAFEIIGRTITEDFVIDRDNRFVFENIAKWCIADASMMQSDNTEGSIYKGIFLSGNTGTGKSVTAKIVCTFLANMGIKYKYFGQESTFAFQSYHSTEICDDFAQKGDLSKYIAEPMLNIEDLGAEAEILSNGSIKAETLYMGNRANVLRRILEARGDKARITMITSNFRMTGDKIVKAYGNRVASRMKEMFNYFELTGNDRRK